MRKVRVSRDYSVRNPRRSETRKFDPGELGIHMSVHSNTIPNYSQQDATLLDPPFPINALNVSDRSSAHHQEHTTVYTD
jgi:hypothetical protein